MHSKLLFITCCKLEISECIAQCAHTKLKSNLLGKCAHLVVCMIQCVRCRYDWRYCYCCRCHRHRYRMRHKQMPIKNTVVARLESQLQAHLYSMHVSPIISMYIIANNKTHLNLINLFIEMMKTVGHWCRCRWKI